MTVRTLFLKVNIFDPLSILGTFFIRWMQCKLRQDHITNRPSRYSDIAVHNIHRPSWPSLTEQLKDFNFSNNAKNVTIYVHHSVAKSNMGSLPLLSNQKNKNQGIFLFK
jgi:hypothetical protein